MPTWLPKQPVQKRESTRPALKRRSAGHSPPAEEQRTMPILAGDQVVEVFLDRRDTKGSIQGVTTGPKEARESS